MPVPQNIVDLVNQTAGLITNARTKIRETQAAIATENATPTTPPPTTPTEPLPEPAPSPISPTDNPNDAIPPGFPHEGNTGVRAGVVLADAAPATANVAGAVVKGKRFRGSLTITQPNVTLEDCEILGNSYWAIKTRADTKLLYCNIDGGGIEGCHGVMGGGETGFCKITGCENGVTGQMNGGRVHDNLIHKFRAAGAPHFDGIQLDGGMSDWEIKHNSIILEANQTGTVMIDNYFGSMSNVRVLNNFLRGGGITVYSDGQFTRVAGATISGVVFDGNLLAKGYWAYTSFVNNRPTWTNNKKVTFDSAGKPVIGPTIDPGGNAI